jgi:hypothetical protein
MQPELVILIHGTGAGSPNDDGDRWWQRGSAFWRSLDEICAPDAACGPTDGRLFHWSGVNSEAERRNAGLELFLYLKALDRRGTPYHLVCHSHGGSVAWRALLESVRRREPLECLRDWITIGTPFLNYGADRGRVWLCLPLIAAVVAGLAVYPSAVALAEYARPIIQDKNAAPVLALLALWSILAIGGGIVVWGLVVLGLALRRVRAEARTADLAWTEYGRRWRGIYSDDDEAVNGLRATLIKREDLVPRVRASSTSVLGGILAWLVSPIRVVYNRLVAPASDDFVWRHISRQFQGTDIPGLSLRAVNRSPHRSATSGPLPSALNVKLVELANANAAATLAGLRNAFGVAAASSAPSGLLVNLQRELSWNELVHTSYFSVEEIRSLLRPSSTPHDGDADPGLDAPVPAPWQGDAGPWTGQGHTVWAAVALFLTACVAGAAMMGSIVHRASVETYTDDYQILQVVSALSLEAVASMAGGSYHGDDIEKWMDALVRAGHASAVVSAGFVCADCEPEVRAGLFARAFTALVANERVGLAFELADAANARFPPRVMELSLLTTIRELPSDWMLSAGPRVAARLREKWKTSPPPSADDGGWLLKLHDRASIDNEITLALIAAQALHGQLSTAILGLRNVKPADRGTVPVDILRELMKREDDASALAIAEYLDEDFHTVDLPGLAALLHKKNRPLEASAVLDRAAAAARREDRLLSLAKDLVRLGILAEAKKLAFELHRSGSESSLIEVAVEFARIGHVPEAIECLQAVSLPASAPQWGLRREFTEGWKVVFAAALRTGSFERAEALVARFGELERRRASYELAEALASAGNFDGALRVASTIKQSRSRNIALLRSVAQKAEGTASWKSVSGRLLELVRLLPPRERVDDFASVVDKSGPGRESAALAREVIGFASELDSPAKQRVVVMLSDSGMLEDALKVFLTIPPSDRDSVVASLFVAHLRNQQWDEGIRLVQGAGAIEVPVQLIPLTTEREKVVSIARALAQHGSAEDGVVYAARCGFVDVAVDVVRAAPAERRERAVGTIASMLVEDGHSMAELESQVVGFPREFQDWFRYAMAFSLSHRDRLGDGLLMASRVTDLLNRQDATTRLLDSIPSGKGLTSDGLTAAWGAVRRVLDPEIQMRLLVKVGQGFSSIGEYRAARLACTPTSVAHRAECFGGILNDYVSAKELES